MNRYILFIVLMVGVLLVTFPQSSYGQDGEDFTDQNDVDSVIIALTRLDVNDTTLELSYKIKNNTDHDVWICDSLSPEYPSFYEYFLDKDAKTLVLRRRSDLPMREVLTMKYPPLRSRYVRLRSGQEKAEFVSLAVPVQPYRISEGESGNAEYAKRLVLEIGFYNEDLPGLILQVVELAEKLNCDLGVGVGDDLEICDRFFGGRNIAQAFDHLIGFSESVMSASVDGEFTIHYMGPVLNGEQVLRIEVDNVSIPYNGIVPSADEPPQSETEPAGVTMALTGLDVNDTTLDLSWKIKNDTDHDVWICASLKPGESPVFEWFLDGDGTTFLIRRRFNLTIEEGVIWEFPFYKSRYQRLRSGQEKAESLSIALPVRPRPVFQNLPTNAEYAERLAIEIGLYDEDLPGLILDIVELAEKLNCDISLQSSIIIDNPDGHTEQFFGGVRIARAFHSENSAAFRNSVLSGGDELSIPYMGQALAGEQVLRIEVDSVSIPYKSSSPPLAGHEGKSTENQQSRQTSSSNKDKPEDEKG